MKLLHCADLHIGKRLNEFNLIEDQKHILRQILTIAEEEAVEAVLIAGDVYDKTQPSAEAVGVLDEFLTDLASLNLSVFVIAGNHDSPERLSFGSRILEKNRLHIAGAFGGVLERVTLKDEHGPLHIHLLPFVKPAQVRPFFKESIESFDQALRAILNSREINTKERNVLMAHQFITDGAFEPERSESEIISVGGLDSIDVSAFPAFDYVALGHLHRPQSVGTKTVRYGGSPLKYSFSEVLHEKSVTLVELGCKGEISLSLRPLVPKRDLREIKGPIQELLAMGKEDQEGAQDYLRIILTDEEEIYDPLGQLREVYPNLMALDFENSRSGHAQLEIAAMADVSERSPLDLFADFYLLQQNDDLSEEQIRILEEMFDKAGDLA